MSRRTQHRERAALLDDAAVAEDRDAIGEARDDREIVADQHDAEAIAACEFGEERQDLCLGRDVEGGGRLVRDQQARRQRGCERERDPLSLAARQLVWIAIGRHAAGSETDPLERCRSANRGLGARRAGVHQHRLGDLGADREQRIQRGRRLLEHEPDAAAAHVLERSFGCGEQVTTLETHAAARRRAARQEPRDRERGHRFPGPRFAGEPDDLAGLDRERQLAQHHPGADRDRQRLK